MAMGQGLKDGQRTALQQQLIVIVALLGFAYVKP
jgi:hypothetical protein